MLRFLFATMESDKVLLLKCEFVVISAAVSINTKYADTLTSPGNG